MKLALDTGLALQTVTNWDRGKAVTEANDRLLLRVSSQLGFVRENEIHPEENMIDRRRSMSCVLINRKRRNNG
jgi:hypothetical protein